MKIVLDTNVLVSAFVSRGLCEAVFEMCLASHDLFVSEHILGEMARNLKGKIKIPARQAEEMVSFVRRQALVVASAKVPPGACRDANDLAVLGTAAAAGADCLVTGDKDLLALRRYRAIAILSPRAFHDRAQSQPPI